MITLTESLKYRNFIIGAPGKVYTNIECDKKGQLYSRRHLVNEWPPTRRGNYGALEGKRQVDTD